MERGSPSRLDCAKLPKILAYLKGSVSLVKSFCTSLSSLSKASVSSFITIGLVSEPSYSLSSFITIGLLFVPRSAVPSFIGIGLLSEFSGPQNALSLAIMPDFETIWNIWLARLRRQNRIAYH